MNANLRVCLAHLVARLTNQAANSAVYDHTQGKHIHISGNVSSTAVNIYDHDRGAHVSGTLTNLYDHGTGAHVSLSVNGAQFNGYDYGSGCHYSGNINGSSATIYDYETGQHHYYGV